MRVNWGYLAVAVLIAAAVWGYIADHQSPEPTWADCAAAAWEQPTEAAFLAAGAECDTR